MDNQGIRIPSLDAKDIYLANHLETQSPEGYSLIRTDGTINMRKFVNVLDYSLDLIKLRDVYSKVYRNKYFTFISNGYEHTNKVINVTFKYSVKEFNLIGNNTYVKYGYRLGDKELVDGVYIEDGQLIAIQVETKIETPVDPLLLDKWFEYSDKKYHIKRIDTLFTVSDLRKDLYSNGFILDGCRYVRFKRSSGSSRVGKCLFIDERLYPAMHRFEMCGVKVKRGEQIDLAALEAYIALTLSSIIDTVEIPPESILVVDDYDSIFKDTVIATKAVNGKLQTDEEEVTIKNSIWDGQSLIDISLMGEYSCYGMILLRSHFFKSCAFNTNIQQFFADNGITDVKQLNGFTMAKDISQVKFITTPNSIKYTKFGTIKKWLKQIGPTFGVVKHEKKTHFFDGRMVQTHYQLLNTLQLSREEMQEFLQPSMDYMDLLRTEPAVLRYHIHLPEDQELSMGKYKSKNDIVFQLLGLNEEFTKTKIYRDFCRNTIKAYKHNMLYGHILVDGNYSTLFGNPMEMLLHSIGKFKGESVLGVGNVHSTRFQYGERLLGSRSPHVCVGNILLTNNVACDIIDHYFNLTQEIVCINSINENILQRLSGADFDSDTMLLTNDPLLVSTAEKNYDLFKVSTSLVESTKSKRYYTPEQQADLDIKTSVNKIGEIVNLSQELQTLMWHKLNNGASWENVKSIYYDACQLNVMSGIEIDMAKKEFDIDNEKELQEIRKRWIRRNPEDGRAIKPYFFGHVDKTKGFYNEQKKKYMKHDTSMDYLREIVENYKFYMSADKELSYILNSDLYNHNQTNWSNIPRIVYNIEHFKRTSFYIWNGYAEMSNRYELYLESENKLIDLLNSLTIGTATLYALVRRLEKEDLSEFVLRILFNIGNETAFNLLKEATSKVPMLEESIDGDIYLYDKKFKKSQ